ncbi:MAG: hypothetical protein HN704_14690 [Bacteroidetes bacterium]|jgi:hypothetical protein|nr:hypothetical protein [Bacteroidota bacterium]MBT7492845.1 hypothetical protein [Bacteroidota bacterium]
MKAEIIEKGKFYYYAKEVRKMLCIEVGEEQSKFTDYKKSLYQFDNHDMYIDKYKN